MVNPVVYYDKIAGFHKSQTNLLPGQGYRLTSLSVYGGKSATRYAAIWLNRDGPESAPFQDKTGKEFQDLFDTIGKNYSLTVITATGSRDDPIFAGVFEKTGKSFFAHSGLTACQFQEKCKSAQSNGYILRWATAYGTPTEPVYGGTWEENTRNLAWTTRIDNTASQYQNTFNTYVNNNEILMNPEIVALSDNQKYLSLWCDNSIGDDWIAIHDRTSSQLKNELDNHNPEKDGYFPIRLEGGGSGINSRFAAIFVKQYQLIPQAKNSAAAFTWDGYIDTDIKFSEFFNVDHTVMARVMLQYPRGYQGPIFAINGNGNYVIAQGDYGDVAEGVKLQIGIGNAKGNYTLPAVLKPGIWLHLAVVRSGNKMTFYVDGQPTIPDGSSGDLSLNPTDTTLPSLNGTLRIGRNKSGNAQFYGLIDDIAIFNKALSGYEIKQKYMTRDYSFTGLENNLVAAWDFSEGRIIGQAKLRRPLLLQKAVFKVPSTRKRLCGIDSQFFPIAARHQQMTAIHLPFVYGQQWKVVQGFGQSTSHNSTSCFNYDFARVDGPTPEQPLYSVAPGKIVFVSDGNDPEPDDNISKDASNYFVMEIGKEQMVTNMHVKNLSMTAAFKALGHTSFPPASPPFQVNDNVLVAKVGNRWTVNNPNNWHLHFGCRFNITGGPNIPLAFSNYERLDKDTNTWCHVDLGVPQQDDIVRRPEPSICEELRHKIKLLETDKDTLQKDLQQASPTEKPPIVKQINDLNAQIDKLHNQLVATGCMT